MARAKIKKVAIPAILLLILAGITLADYLRTNNTPLSGNGTIEGKEIKVIAEVGGKLENLLVSEGDTVLAGDLLAEVEDRPYEIQVQIAQAQQSGAQASYDEADAGARAQEIAAAEHEVAQLRAQLTAAQKSYSFQKSLTERYEGLFDTGALTSQELDAQVLQEQKAEQQNNALQEQVRAAEAKLSLLREGASSQSLERLSAGVGQSAENLELARLNLARTELKAPADGTVTSCNFEVGEILRAGSEVITLLDTENLWLNTYIREDKLGKVAVGKAVKLAVDAYPGEYFSGTVSFIAPKPEFTPRSIQTKEDRVNLVFRIKVEVTDESGKLMPGMPADVYFE